ncbi:unnamed protein product [Spirodela intermedia]|uniref:RING-type E3 ubiquitin transferase n=1 Tax=Spirodela intermedia TaxID=51605 RepID=A0A7I8KNT9_SPIIN|nr:unnamed protein product [Spirodela intermedia]
MGDRLQHVGGATASPASAPPPVPLPPAGSPIRPALALAIGIITTILSVVCLALLYARHCRRSTGGGRPYGGGAATVGGRRRNSGVGRAVVESLPLFRFGSLRGPKKEEGLDCAVCLCRFEESELLRLLPKCKHAFHVDCIDTWLDAHGSCPLCRFRVDPEDVLLPFRRHELASGGGTAAAAAVGSLFRAPGRHSSAGEKRSGATAAPPAGRKDGLLLGHQIVVASDGDPEDGSGGEISHRQRRWSDVRPQELLFLRREMILTGGGWPCRGEANAPG